MAIADRSPAPDGKPGRRVAPQELHLPRPEGSERWSLERLVNEAAEQITRFSAPEAHSVAAGGGLIIDIRSQDARKLYGVIPGSLHIPRTVLEWRIALDSPWRNPHLGGLDQRLMLICDHGYSSILAARTLVQLGFDHAADVIGGFESWKDNGLPIAPWRHRLSAVGGLPGIGPPEPGTGPPEPGIGPSEQRNPRR